MKQQLLFSRSPYQTFFLAIGIFLISTLSVHAQKYYELHDAYHNRAAMGGDSYNSETYHQYAFGRENGQWQFVHVADSFYTIKDKKHNKLLAANENNNNNQIYHREVGTLPHLLWSLVDVDGRGVLFLIKNKKYPNKFIAAPNNGNGDLYLWDTTGVVNKSCASWRLIERPDGTDPDIIPKDVKGKEIKATSEYVFTTANNSTFHIYGLPNTLCGTVLGKQVFDGLNYPGNLPNEQAFMNSFQPAQYGALDQTREGSQIGKDKLISIYVNSPHRLSHGDNYVDLKDPNNNVWAGEKDEDEILLPQRGEANYNGNKYFYTGEYRLNTVNSTNNLPFGTSSMLSRFYFEERNFNNGNDISNVVLQFPCVVSGIVEDQVKALGYTTEPMVPYLVLHDPPGDGSTSSFGATKTICRDFENSYTVDQSTDVHAAVKIGVAGSIGFIATVDYEFSVEFSGGATNGELIVKTSANSNCISTTEGFETSALDPVGEGGSDVFIGFGYDLDYGKYQVIEFDHDSCKMDKLEKMIYSLRGSGQDAFRRFVLTEGGIQKNITDLAQTVVTSSDERTRANAQYQINAWERVLAANESVIANASVKIGDQLLIDGGGQSSNWSEEITVSQTNTLQTEHYLVGTAGMETVLEIGGSGGSFGFNYTNEKRYGASVTDSESDAKVVSYNLSDGDSDDIFYVDVFRDDRYGTPLFRLTNGTNTSCPYEGGYQKDQPLLKLDGQSGDHILMENVPGEIATILLDMCNLSNVSRTYLVALGGQNPGGATVRLGGNTISANPYPITVGPNTCAEDYVLTVQRNPGINAYPNLQIDMYPECDGNISSSITASVYFGIVSAVLEQSPVSLLSVFPNPTSGELIADFTMEESADVRFELYDMVGNRSVLASEENFAAGPNRKEMNVAQLPSGIYQLAIKTNKSVISRKVIVQH